LRISEYHIALLTSNIFYDQQRYDDLRFLADYYIERYFPELNQNNSFTAAPPDWTRGIELSCSS
jgi:uncharacterized protein YdiU (UPF0061 family)